MPRCRKTSMTAETLNLVIAVASLIGAWTVTVALFAYWLREQFRHLEVIIYRELQKLDDEYAEEVNKIHTRIDGARGRIYRLELKNFGFTLASEVNPDQQD